MPRENEGPTADLAPFACFDCRRVFKRPGLRLGAPLRCSHCGGTSYQMDVRFQPPRRSDARRWRVVCLLAEHGFFAQPVYRHSPGGDGMPVAYPDSPWEARWFVKEFSSQALGGRAAPKAASER